MAGDTQGTGNPEPAVASRRRTAESGPSRSAARADDPRAKPVDGGRSTRPEGNRQRHGESGRRDSGHRGEASRGAANPRNTSRSRPAAGRPAPGRSAPGKPRNMEERLAYYREKYGDNFKVKSESARSEPHASVHKDSRTGSQNTPPKPSQPESLPKSRKASLFSRLFGKKASEDRK